MQERHKTLYPHRTHLHALPDHQSHLSTRLPGLRLVLNKAVDHSSYHRYMLRNGSFPLDRRHQHTYDAVVELDLHSECTAGGLTQRMQPKRAHVHDLRCKDDRCSPGRAFRFA